MDFQVFACRLKALRTSKNLTLQQLGSEVHATKATIGNLENSNKQPSLVMVCALADYFRVSLDYLTGRSDVPDMLIRDQDGSIVVVEAMAPPDTNGPTGH